MRIRAACLILAALVFIYTLLITPTFTQEIPSIPQIAPGETVVAEISDSQVEHRYRFAALANEIVVIEMRSLDRSFHNPLWAPVLVLLDANGAVLADTTAAYSVDDARIVAELLHAGEYTIIATREGGAQGESFGGFELTLMQVPLLGMGVAVEDSLSSDEGIRYYAVRAGQDFRLNYQHQEGDFFPQVALHRLDEAEGGLREVAVVRGREMEEVVFGTFAANTTYILTLHESDTEFNSTPVRLEYRIEVVFVS
ncbi:MAG: hypothetical protein SF029_19790 [bacterium]|nr:hypothetical protein [bacterium]